jgi:hypothetical protein
VGLPVAGVSGVVLGAAQTTGEINLAMSGVDKVILLAVHTYNSNNVATAALRGLGAFTSLASLNKGFPPPFARFELFKFEDPPAGSQWIDISFGSSSTFVGGAQLFTDAGASPKLGTVAIAINSGSLSQITVDSDILDLVADFLAAVTSGSNPTLAPGPGQTESYEQEETSNSKSVINSSWKAGANPTTLMEQVPSIAAAALHHFGVAIRGTVPVQQQTVTMPIEIQQLQSGTIRLGS